MEVDEVVAVLFVMLDELEVVDFVLVLVSVADEVVVVEVVIFVLLLVLTRAPTRRSELGRVEHTS